MTSIGMTEQSDDRRREFENEAVRIINSAKTEGITLRLLGSISFQFQCPKFAYLQKDLGRSYTDIDYAAYSGQSSKVVPLFSSLGYNEDAEINLYYAGQRMIFYHRTNGIHVDIFFDKLDFCHEIRWAGRLEIEESTLPLAEMLLEKMQIVKINEKDIIDTIILLLEKPIGDVDNNTINVKLIAGLCARDWGLWRTVTMNLSKIARLVHNYDAITSEQREKVVAQVEKINSVIDTHPKTNGWKLRAKIGDKIKWYKEVEEVN